MEILTITTKVGNKKKITNYCTLLSVKKSLVAVFLPTFIHTSMNFLLHTRTGRPFYTFMKKSKRVFTEDEREGWMKWKNKKIKEEGNKCNLSKLLEDIPNAPSRGTILRWEHKQQTIGNVETMTKNWGRPSLLTSGEMEVVAGWILTQEFKEEVVRAIDIINFVKDSFNLNVSKQWVSEAV